MKRTALALILLVMLAFCSCGEKETDFSVDIVSAADEIIRDNALSGGTRYSSLSETPGGFLDEDLIRAFYGDAADTPDFSKISAYEVYIDETKPVLPCEFGIFELSDPSYAEQLIKYLKARIELKLANAKMYPSVQTSMLKTAKFTAKGKYVWYCAIKDANESTDSYLNNFGSTEK